MEKAKEKRKTGPEGKKNRKKPGRSGLTPSASDLTSEKKEKIYLDTFVFMDILSGHRTFMEKTMKYLEKIKTNKAAGVISSILFTELTYHLSIKRSREKAEEILYYIETLPNVDIVPVTAEIAKRAGSLRARYRKRIEKKLTYFDSIHLATALITECTKFVTGDRGFADIKEIEMEIY